jgi:hypothetical protein
MAPTCDPHATGHLVDQWRLATPIVIGLTVQVLASLTKEPGSHYCEDPPYVQDVGVAVQETGLH